MTVSVMLMTLRCLPSCVCDSRHCHDNVTSTHTHTHTWKEPSWWLLTLVISWQWL